MSELTAKDTEKSKELQKSQGAKRPWQPASILHIPAKFKDSRFVYRWATESKEGNIRKKLMEGWIHDKEVAKKMEAANFLQNQTILDGSSPDGNLRMREMVLMRMPVEMAKERTLYYQEKSVAAKEDAQARYDEAMEGRGYGKIKYK